MSGVAVIATCSNNSVNIVHAAAQHAATALATGHSSRPNGFPRQGKSFPFWGFRIPCMCVTFFLWEHPSLPDMQLLALFNRDEVLKRPSAAAHFWRDQPHILGGRDLVAGGTWMCVSTAGRAAFLTNFRDAQDTNRAGTPSRGALPVACVSSPHPEAFMAALDAEAYPGFNLVGVDLARGRLMHLCHAHDSSSGHARVLGPGLHGVTNGHMESAWPKVQEGLRRLQQLLDSGAFGSGGSSHSGGGANGADSAAANGSKSAGRQTDATDAGVSAGIVSSGTTAPAHAGSSSVDPTPVCSSRSSGSGGDGRSSTVPWGELFSLLSDGRLLETDPRRLPATGYGPDFEGLVSGICVQPVDTPWGSFGTRSKTVLAVWRDGTAELRERYLQEDGTWDEVRHAFELHLDRNEAGGASVSSNSAAADDSGKSGAATGVGCSGGD